MYENRRNVGFFRLLSISANRGMAGFDRVCSRHLYPQKAALLPPDADARAIVASFGEEAFQV